MKAYLAIDIGASSGRHIVGWREQGQIRTREVYRFPNGLVERDGHLVWDPRRLFSQVVRGLLEAFRAFPEIESLSTDTWGVDYVLLKDDRELYPVYAYRDRRTERVIPKVHEKKCRFRRCIAGPAVSSSPSTPSTSSMTTWNGGGWKRPRI